MIYPNMKEVSVLPQHEGVLLSRTATWDSHRTFHATLWPQMKVQSVVKSERLHKSYIAEGTEVKKGSQFFTLVIRTVYSGHRAFQFFSNEPASTGAIAVLLQGVMMSRDVKPMIRSQLNTSSCG